MKIEKAFTVLFDDEKWLNKTLMGALFAFLSMFLIGIPFLMGYVIRMVKQGMAGQFLPLPEWDDLGGLFKEGIMFCVVILVYGIGLSIISVMLNIIPCLGFILSLIVMMLFGGVFAYLVITFAKTGKIEDCFDFKGMYSFIEKNLSNLVMYILFVFVLNIIASFGVILIFIGVFFSYFWFLVGNAYLIVELEKEAKHAIVE